MADQTNIEWCDSTFNPFIGCTKVSPGCDNCYAENLMDRRMHKVQWGPHGPRVRTSPGNWRKPLTWNKAHAEFFAKHGRRQRVFCASLADVFDNAVDPAWRRDLFDLIELTPNLDWLLLTKRIGNVQDMVRAARPGDWLLGQRNVRLGATIVTREEMLRDAPKLKAVLAHSIFWSAEPLLGDMGDIPPELLPDWVIAGGESGAGSRPTHPNWSRSLRDQCAAAGVPFLYKQNGEWFPACDYYSDDDTTRDKALDRPHMLITGSGTEWCVDFDGQPPPGTWIMHKVGKKAAGRLLDGVQYDGFPA